MSLVFLQPYLLFGLGAAVLPLIIHLISQQQSKRIKFSTVRFLVEADKSTARKHRLVDLIALLLRMLILMLVASALAKPVLREKGSGVAAKGEITRVVLIDDSYSTGYSENGTSHFSLMLKAVRESLDVLRKGDEVYIVTTSGILPETLHGALQSFQTAKDDLSTLVPSYTASALLHGLNRAIEILEVSKKPVREIVIVTDGQERTFKGIEEINIETFLQLRARIYLLSVGKNRGRNVSLTDTAVRVPVPYPGMEVIVRPVVRNFSDQASTTRIELWAEKENLGSKIIALKPDEKGSVNFIHTFLSPGEYRCEVKLSNDELLADNSYYFVVPQRNELRVLIIMGEHKENIFDDETFFLESALKPVKTMRKSFITITKNLVGNVNPSDIATHDIVILADVPTWSNELDLALKDFVRKGGGMVIIPGSLTARHIGSQSEKGKEYLGFTLSGTVEENVSLAKVDFTKPIFMTFKGDPAFDTTAASFTKYFTVRPATAGIRSEVVTKFSNDDPFMLEQTLGTGRVVLFTSPCNVVWGNLPVRSLFLPLIHELTKYMVIGEYTTAALRVHSPIEIVKREKGDKEIRIRTPGEREEKVREKEGVFTFTDTSVPGIYEAHTSEGSLLFAVNSDPVEGELIYRDHQDIQSLFSEQLPVKVCGKPGELVTLLRRVREGASVASYLLYTALAFLLLEVYLANVLLPAQKKKSAEKASALQRD